MKNFLPLIGLTVCSILFHAGAAQEKKPIRIFTGGVLCGKAVSLPKPPYPKEAKEAKAFGAVHVKILIGVDGKVETAEAVSGHELLRKSAEQAALAAKFAPTTVSGEAVKISGIIVYNFVAGSTNKSADQIQKPEEKSKETENEKPKLPIINGKANYLPIPDYPQEAKDFCADGKVEVETLLDEDGNVIEAKAISGNKLLQNSAVEAAKKAKFTMGHFRVKLKGILVYNFVPEKKCNSVSIENSR